MPLQLLGKKSWNVYNHANIERVRQDEEIARKKEEAEEARMQQEDSERKMAELRRRAAERQIGGVPRSGGEGTGGPGSPDEGGLSQRMQVLGNVPYAPRTRETDAHQADDSALISSISKRSGYREGSSVDPQVHSSLTDGSGHINFFLEGSSRSRGQPSRDKNPEHEKEKKEQEAKIAEQFTMALGKPADELKPWYVTLNKIGEKQEKKTEKQLEISKRRDERFKDRNDPMMMMRKGVRQLKELEEDRKKLQAEQGSELDRLRMEQADLEGFCLDVQGPPDEVKRRRQRRSRSRERRSTKHRSRRRSRSPVSEFDKGKDRNWQSGDPYRIRRDQQMQEHGSEHSRRSRHRSYHKDRQ